MGGKAFAETLHTPRIPPEIYIFVRDHVLGLLRQHLYKYADSPIESPGKSNHGDIDILVCEPLLKDGQDSRAVDVTPQEIAELLNAKTYKVTRGSHTINFAIPWPDMNSLQHQNNFRGGDDQEPEDANRYIQVDIQACPTLTQLKWSLFHEAHGDLWNMLGARIRKYGLTLSNTGLHLRIEELEGWNKEKSRVKLTQDPKEALEFLQMDEQGEFGDYFPSLNSGC